MAVSFSFSVCGRFMNNPCDAVWRWCKLLLSHTAFSSTIAKTVISSSCPSCLRRRAAVAMRSDNCFAPPFCQASTSAHTQSVPSLHTPSDIMSKISSSLSVTIALSNPTSCKMPVGNERHSARPVRPLRRTIVGAAPALNNSVLPV